MEVAPVAAGALGRGFFGSGSGGCAEAIRAPTAHTAAVAKHRTVELRLHRVFIAVSPGTAFRRSQRRTSVTWKSRSATESIRNRSGNVPSRAEKSGGGRRGLGCRYSLRRVAGIGQVGK